VFEQPPHCYGFSSSLGVDATATHDYGEEVEYERHLAWSVMRGITQILGQRHGEVAARSIEAHLVKLVIAFPVEVGNSRCIRQCGRWLSTASQHHDPRRHELDERYFGTDIDRHMHLHWNTHVHSELPTMMDLNATRKLGRDCRSIHLSVGHRPRPEITVELQTGNIHLRHGWALRSGSTVA
jgi:hypothetical protein